MKKLFCALAVLPMWFGIGRADYRFERLEFPMPQSSPLRAVSTITASSLAAPAGSG